MGFTPYKTGEPLEGMDLQEEEEEEEQSTKKIKHTEYLFRKNLQWIDVC